jgi:hypothetical protein
MDYNNMDLLLNLSNNRMDCIHSLPYSLSDGAWYHFASVYDFDKKEIRLYFNGKLIGSCPYDKPIVSNNEDLYFGASFPGGQEYFRGDLDEIRIFNRALDDNEVIALYLAGSTQGIISASQPVIDFGSVFPATDTTISLIIRNKSLVSLPLIPASMKYGTDFSASSQKTSLSPGDSDTVFVRFTGTAPGIYYDTLLIGTDINCEPTILQIPVRIEIKDYFRLRVWFEDTTAISGTKNFGLVMKSILRNYDTTISKIKVNGEIRFPADAFMPENIQGFTFQDNGVSNGKRIIGFSGITTARPDTNVVLILTGTVLMPDSAYNRLEITRFDLDNPLVKPESGENFLHVITCAFDLSHISLINRAEISLYPNPTGGELFADYDNITDGILNYTIYNSQGFDVANGFLNLNESPGRININTSGLASGLYNITFNINGTSISRQFVIIR